MRYLSDRAEAYRHPRHVLEGVRSLLVLAYPYRTAEPQASQPGRGRVSRYAWGVDYHDVVRERLRTLSDFFSARAPELRVRTVIDTAPLLEREFAALAGLGWIGKNTLLLNSRPAVGSFWRPCSPTGCSTTTNRTRPIIVARAGRASTRVPPMRSSTPMFSTLAAASAISRSSCARRFPWSCAKAWATGSSAATCARTFAPGTTSAAERRAGLRTSGRDDDARAGRVVRAQ